MGSIIHMINIKLLFWVTRTTGNYVYDDIALSLANLSLQEHFWPDASFYHLIDFDQETGKVQNRQSLVHF